MRSFVKENPRQMAHSISLCKSCPSSKFLTSQICLLTLLAKIKFSRKFPNLQYTRDGVDEGSEQRFGFRPHLKALHKLGLVAKNLSLGFQTKRVSHMRSFVKETPRKMAHSISRLLIYVNHALVPNF